MERASSTQHLVPVVSKITGEPAVPIIGLRRSSRSGNDVNQISKNTLKSQPKLESESELASEPELDPCFGECLEGRKVSKLFGDAYYSGKVAQYNAEANWYRVEYEDGDCEDLYWHELEDVLVPLGNTPLPDPLVSAPPDVPETNLVPVPVPLPVAPVVDKGKGPADDGPKHSLRLKLKGATSKPKRGGKSNSSSGRKPAVPISYKYLGKGKIPAGLRGRPNTWVRKPISNLDDTIVIIPSDSESVGFESFSSSSESCT
ncbi:Dirigent protein 17 [Carex littledalei]|uniref:Dirigent protein 17 n=1 Tax=Carex littledalei TaxID=544730 RepID=A0A833RL36_9POAL|nr:Dirigent protein 17 [Carex littledalei]